MIEFDRETVEQVVHCETDGVEAVINGLAKSVATDYGHKRHFHKKRLLSDQIHLGLGCSLNFDFFTKSHAVCAASWLATIRTRTADDAHLEQGCKG
jgi:hypothetical protein